MKTAYLIPLLALNMSLACSKDENKPDEASAKTTETAKAAPAATPKTDKPLTNSGDNTAKKVGLDTGGKSLGGEAVQLSKLKFGGSGFEGEFNEALDSWKFEKWVPRSDGGNDKVVTIYLDAWDSDWPADMDAFATKLGEKNFLDYGSKWPVIAAKTAFEGGWVITGDWSDDEDTEKAFAVRVNALGILCRGTVNDSAKDKEKTRTEAIEACKAATM